MVDRLEQRPVHLRGVRREAVERRRPDAAPGLVHDPAQRDLVGRVVDHLEIGDRVLDLGPLVEPRPADDPVADALAHEHVLEHARLGVHPVEDGDVSRAGALLERPGDLPRDEPGLGVLVVGLDHAHRQAPAEVGPQLLRPPVGVAGDHGVGGIEDRLGRAVVLLEGDDPGAGEIMLELGDVADVGAAEGVDRLVGVADHGDVAVLGRQDGQQPELGMVRVLVLVDHDVAEALLPRRAGLLVGLEQEHGLEDHVVEVH